MSKRDNRRVIRVELDEPLSVVLGSIGSDVRYDLGTRNISNTGFFLDFDKPGRFPFTEASIMEVWLSVGGEDKVFFNGKMARVVLPTDDEAQVTGPGIAIRIIQIDPEQQQLLNKFVSEKTGAVIEDEGEEEEAS